MKTCVVCERPLPDTKFKLNNAGKRNPKCRDCAGSTERADCHLTTEWIQCRNGCPGVRGKVYVEYAGRRPAVLCESCKEQGAPEHRKALAVGEYSVAQVLGDFAPSGPVIHYKRGEPMVNYCQSIYPPPKNHAEAPWPYRK
jgi:hypothetical protein